MNELFRFGRDEDREREADECDRMAREMLADPEWRAGHVARFAKAQACTSKEILDDIITFGWRDHPWVREALEADLKRGGADGR